MRLVKVPIDVDQEPTNATIEALDDAELARLDRLSNLADRARFATVRSALRKSLGRALGLAARDVPIEIDQQGKPRVVGDALWFSVAHCGTEGLIAICRSRRIGVDLEARTASAPIEPLVELALSCEERQLWQAASLMARETLFFRAWTAKEALLKASGQGLLTNPAYLTVLDGPDGLRARGDPSLIGFDPERARVRALPAPMGYAAAVAVIGGPCTFLY